MVTCYRQPFTQSTNASRPFLLSLLLRPFAFPLAPPSLTERKVPSASSVPAAIGGRSDTGRPNQSALRNKSLDVIGQRSSYPLLLRSSLPAGGSEAGQVGAGPGSRFGCAGARAPEVNTGVVGVGPRAGPGRWFLSWSCGAARRPRRVSVRGRAAEARSPVFLPCLGHPEPGRRPSGLSARPLAAPGRPASDVSHCCPPPASWRAAESRDSCTRALG